MSTPETILVCPEWLRNVILHRNRVGMKRASGLSGYASAGAGAASTGTAGVLGRATPETVMARLG